MSEPAKQLQAAAALTQAQRPLIPTTQGQIRSQQGGRVFQELNARVQHLEAKLQTSFELLEANSIARIHNSHARSGDCRLMMVRSLNTAHLNDFPETINDLVSLKDRVVIRLLVQLDLSLEGTAACRMERFAQHIGVIIPVCCRKHEEGED